MSVLVALLAALLLAPFGLSGGAADSATTQSSAVQPSSARMVAPEPARAVTLPEPGAAWDYQIGGAYAPDGAVQVVSRDRNARPLADAYSVCYVNAYQTQPDEKRFWRDDPDRWRLVLKKDGRPVVDGAWGEWLLDTRTAEKRTALARIVGRWTRGCADDGFQAVEYDNLDSWGRSKHLLTVADNVALARLLTGRAHDAGLAAAQKNAAGLAARGPSIGFDLAVAEQCGQYRECGTYARAYDDQVLVVEYSDAGLERACAGFGDTLSIVRRDVDVTPGGPVQRC